MAQFFGWLWCWQLLRIPKIILLKREKNPYNLFIQVKSTIVRFVCYTPCTIIPFEEYKMYKNTICTCTVYSTTKQIVNLYKYEKKKAGYERTPQLPRNLPPDISYLYDAKRGQKSIFSLSTIISSVKLFWYWDSLPNHANAFLWLKI